MFSIALSCSDVLISFFLSLYSSKFVLLLVLPIKELVNDFGLAGIFGKQKVDFSLGFLTNCADFLIVLFFNPGKPFI
jgi:hypothetical protein